MKSPWNEESIEVNNWLKNSEKWSDFMLKVTHGDTWLVGHTFPCSSLFYLGALKKSGQVEWQAHVAWKSVKKKTQFITDTFTVLHVEKSNPNLMLGYHTV